MGQGCLSASLIIAFVVAIGSAGFYYSRLPGQNSNNPLQTAQPTSTLNNLGQVNPEDTSMKQGTFTFEETTPLPTSPPATSCRDLDISMIMDRSSSMNANVNGKQKLEFAKEAATTVVNSLIYMQSSRPGSVSNVKVGLVSFGRQGDADDTDLGPLDPKEAPKSTEHTALTTNYSAVASAIAGVKYMGSGTCVQCGLYIANRQLKSSVGDKMKVAILLSDGKSNKLWPGNTPGSNIANEKAIEQANLGRNNYGIEYKVLGYGEVGQFDPVTLRAIAGSPDNYQQMADPTQWANAFQEFLNSICSESTIQ